MEPTENRNDKISIWDAIGVIADIQTNFLTSFKELRKFHDIEDFRCNIFFSCYDRVTTSRLILSMLGYSLSNGMQTKEWWVKWGGYYPEGLDNIPDFNIYVNDKTGQLLWYIRDTTTQTLFTYIEGFLRTLARHKGIESKDLYKIRDVFLKNMLGLSEEEVIPLIIYQHLRNSIHNKGIHFNEKYPHVKFILGQYDFEFKHDEKFYFDWHMLRELLLQMNKLLFKIVINEQISQLPKLIDKNFTVRYADNEE